MVPENHIVIDFDIPDENGNKSFERNYEAASKWPPTYAEVSKPELLQVTSSLHIQW